MYPQGSNHPNCIEAFCLAVMRCPPFLEDRDIGRLIQNARLLSVSSGLWLRGMRGTNFTFAQLEETFIWGGHVAKPAPSLICKTKNDFIGIDTSRATFNMLTTIQLIIKCFMWNKRRLRAQTPLPNHSWPHQSYCNQAQSVRVTGPTSISGADLPSRLISSHFWTWKYLVIYSELPAPSFCSWDWATFKSIMEDPHSQIFCRFFLYKNADKMAYVSIFLKSYLLCLYHFPFRIELATSFAH